MRCAAGVARGKNAAGVARMEYGNGGQMMCRTVPWQ